jgi:hypothetical protein
MRIIELGRVIDNNDPLGIGRIRIEYINKVNSIVEKSVPEYSPWDYNDPFMFVPFLPIQVNVVPSVNQLAKLIFWNTDNNLHSKEYISGPYVNSFDIDGQGIDRQLQLTSIGVRIKPDKHIFKPTGELIDPATKGVVVKPQDVSTHGNYGSDIIYTRNGVTIRAGKLDDEKYRKTKKPYANPKLGRISIKKYDQTLEVEEKEVAEDELQHKPILTLVEYNVDNVGSTNNLFDGQVSVYKIVNHIYNVTDTFHFNQETQVDTSNKALIYSKSFTGATLEQIGRDISQELRNIDMTENHSEMNAEFFKINTHPFYYKPSQAFYDSLTTERAAQNAKKLYNYVNLGATSAFGLSYSPIEKYVPSKKVKKKITVQNKLQKPTTIASTLADTIYMLAYDANVPNDSDKINFAKLNNYELTQEEILEEILPKTYSGVRGEPLLYLLELMVKWMTLHVHNPADTPIGPAGLKDELMKEIQSAKEKITNQKLRLN